MQDYRSTHVLRGFIPVVLSLNLIPTFFVMGCCNQSAWADGWETLLEKALPHNAVVAPQQPSRLLVYSDCQGYVHESIPLGATAVVMMGSRTGAWEAVVSKDKNSFQAENLKKFDAILMNNTTGNLFDDPALRQSLLDFVSQGKGIAGIHAAIDCFMDWPEYGEMMGGYFDGHPWGAGDTVRVKIEEADHPLCLPFKGEDFDITEEIYQVRAPYSRKNLRVLLRLDTQHTDMNKDGIHRDDQDFAISWVKKYGEGRVFYCSLGHNHAVFTNPQVLEHYLAGLQYVLGDLKASDIPSAELKQDSAK